MQLLSTQQRDADDSAASEASEVSEPTVENAAKRTATRLSGAQMRQTLQPDRRADQAHTHSYRTKAVSVCDLPAMLLQVGPPDHS